MLQPVGAPPAPIQRPDASTDVTGLFLKPSTPEHRAEEILASTMPQVLPAKGRWAVQPSTSRGSSFAPRIVVRQEREFRLLLVHVKREPTESLLLPAKSGSPGAALVACAGPTLRPHASNQS